VPVAEDVFALFVAFFFAFFAASDAATEQVEAIVSKQQHGTCQNQPVSLFLLLDLDLERGSRGLFSLLLFNAMAVVR
jgi:hypothetical protein